MRAIIIHGTKGSADSNWFPWLAAELHKLHISTIIPALPTPENQSLEQWQQAFALQSGPVSADTILIGHSIGAIFALRLLETLSLPVCATVLVSPPKQEIGIPEYDQLNSTFLERSFNFTKIKVNAGKIIFFMGDNDPYVPKEQMLDLAKDLEVNPTIVKNGGHLNLDSGYSSFPLLLDSIVEII
jgi:predicted alpha/beta hydrolase family esterase